MRCVALALLVAATTLPTPDGRAEPRLSGASTPISPTLCAPAGPDRLRCAGYGGVDVFLFGSQEQRTLSLGGDRPAFPPLPLAGRLGRLVDWHLAADGTPLAGAVHWRAAEGSAELVLLLRPAREDAPGCLQLVSAPEVDLSRLAARRFECGRDRPVLTGPIPPRLHSALQPWLVTLGP